MKPLLWVLLGSGVGGGLRYLVTSRVALVTGGRVPWGTLAVNLLGCFALGLVVSLSARFRSSVTPDLSLLLSTGLLGGFTTYSAFNQETLLLMRSGSLGTALLYVCGTVIGGLAAGALATFLVHRL